MFLGCNFQFYHMNGSGPLVRSEVGLVSPKRNEVGLVSPKWNEGG